MVEAKIKEVVAKAVNLEVGEVHLEVPEIKSHGDFSTNIAMVLFAKHQASKNKSQTKSKFKNPRELAQEIANKLEEGFKDRKIVKKIEVAGPGFINFWLSEDFLLKNLEEILQKGKNYGFSDTNKGKRVIFEYGQPNTHKLPHIGHLFSYVYGESIARILEATGWEVRRCNYQGDVGLQVAKCLWALLRQGYAGQDLSKKTKNLALAEKASLLQKMYQEGSRSYEEDEKAKGEIQDLNKKIYEGESSIKALWQETRKWSVDYYKEFESRLGIRFDRYYFESEVFEKGKEKVLQNVPKVFKKSQNAIIFPASELGLHDRVFITSYDTPTYEAKDFYLEELKFKEYSADLLVITTAHEQNEYFKVVFKALETVHPEYKGKLKHIGFGMVSLKGGKLSSRKGEIIGGIELVEDVVEAVEKITTESSNLKASEVDKVSEEVGVGAVKYSFLKNNPLQDIKFDIKESIAKEGNSAPYLQYTYARAKSILKKASKTKISAGLIKGISLSEEEKSLLRSFVQFSGVISDASKSYSPNLICEFVFDLAQKFNAFYNKHNVLESEKDLMEFRLVLTEGVSQVIKNGLYLLGIEAPERM